MLADMLMAQQSLTASAQALSNSQTSLAEQGLLLRENEQRVSTLSAQLQLWQEYSTELESSLSRLEALLATLRQELQTLKRTYDELSRLHEDSSRAADRQIQARDRQVARWRLTGILAIIAAAIGWLVAIVT